jgi:hypothetical protein
VSLFGSSKINKFCFHISISLNMEWSLDGPLSKLCPVIPTSNQDGHQAKNRKRGDEIFIVHCCFSVSQILTAATWQGVV